MSAGLDHELQAWQREWREQPLAAASVADLAASVHRGTVLARGWTIAAAVLTLGSVFPLILRAARGATDGRFVAGLLLFVALIWVSTLWLARGTWRPRDESTAAFLDVAIRRCRAAMWGAPVGIVLYVTEIAYVLVSLHRIEGGDWASQLRSPGLIVVAFVVGPLYIGGQTWYSLRQRGQLRRWRALQAVTVRQRNPGAALT